MFNYKKLAKMSRDERLDQVDELETKHNNLNGPLDQVEKVAEIRNIDPEHLEMWRALWKRQVQLSALMYCLNFPGTEVKLINRGMAFEITKKMELL